MKTSKILRTVFWNLLFLLIISCTFFCLSVRKADALELENDAVFTMDDGVYLRVNGEKGGMRFRVKMDKDTADSITGETKLFFLVMNSETYENNVGTDFENLDKENPDFLIDGYIFQDAAKGTYKGENDFYYANYVINPNSDYYDTDFCVVAGIQNGNEKIYADSVSQNVTKRLYTTVQKAVLSPDLDNATITKVCNTYNFFGTESYPFRVSDEESFISVLHNSRSANSFIKLTDDVTLTETWAINSVNFAGTLDGDGHIVSDFSIANSLREDDPTKYLNKGCMFASLAQGATIKDIAFKNVQVDGLKNVFTDSNIKADISFENVVMDVESVDNINLAGYKFSMLGYQERNTIRLTNVIIKSPVTTQSSGFITHYIAANQQIDNVICIGSLGLHSATNNTNTPTYTAESGAAGIVDGIDYNIVTDVRDAYYSTEMRNVSVNARNAVASIFASEVNNVTLLTAANIADELLCPTSGYFVLNDNINMSSFTTWGKTRNADGRAYADYYFTGTFNGNGYTISNFTVSQTAYQGGLFWSLDGATIRNLTIKNARFNSGNVGLLSGRTRNGSRFENVFVEIAYMREAGNGLIGVAEKQNVFDNVLVYVKELRSDTITTSGAIGCTYVRSVVASELYYITDTVMPLNPAHATLTTQVFNMAGYADAGLGPVPTGNAVQGTDYYLLTVDEAKELASTQFKTIILRNAFNEYFKNN